MTGMARRLDLDGDLFASGPEAGHWVQLVADREGGVRCWPGFVDAATADAWFAALRDGAEWTTMRRRMYDRDVDVPRLLSSYRVDAFPTHLPLRTILERVHTRVPAPFNAVGMNLYRDGRDSVAMHNDKLHTLVAGHPIAIVSLGDTRRMQLREKRRGDPGIDVDLSHGSLLVMSHACQKTHDHGIPKTTRPVGPRMSVVFRVRPARDG
jgi:alkylated DNA repair dioxygenase AlkB